MPKQKPLPLLFAELIALPATERSAFLDSACHSAPELRREIEELLAFDSLAESGGFLTSLPLSDTSEEIVLGPYRLRELLGRGGMGAVYRAERASDFGLEVAVKIGPPGWAGQEGLLRFHTERQVLASLDHPNIARVLDGGTTPDGRPYLVMELVRGDRIDRHADANNLSTAERVQLLVCACAGVAHAHAEGVIHRDLKPANILVAGGQTKVVDFGLAARPGDGLTLTQTGDILGTPGFLAPEQASGQAKEATPAADVFALGATLYTLLTGRPPFRADTPWQAVRLTLEEEPVPPSRLSPGVSRDLEAICLKCLEKNPTRRYPTARELRADLENYLAGLPVSARPVGWVQRTLRWARRRPLPAALLTLLAIGAIGSFATITVLWRTAVRNEAKAQASAEAAEQRNRTAREALRMYTTAANKLFRNADVSSPEEREALVRALELYEQMLSETEGGDPDEEHAAAYATLQLANGMHNLGEFEVSARTARRAVAVLRRLKDAHPERIRFRYHYSQGCTQLAGTLGRLGHVEEEFAFRSEGIRVCEELATAYPDKTGYLGSLVSFRAHLGGRLIERGELAVAEPVLAAADAGARLAIERQPHYWERYGDFAEARFNYALTVLKISGDPGRYRALMGEALDLLERTRRERPTDWHKAVPRALGMYEWAARMELRAGRRAEARGLLVRGVEFSGAVARRNPADTNVLQIHAESLFCAGLLGWPADPAARTQFRTAIGTLEGAIATTGSSMLERDLVHALARCPDPTVRDTRRAVELARKVVRENPKGQSAFLLGICLCEADEYTAAIAELDAYLAQAPTNPEVRLYRALARWHTGQREAARDELVRIEALLAAEWLVNMRVWPLRDRVWAEIRGSSPPPSPLPPKWGGKP